jgi:hypothetical protein
MADNIDSSEILQSMLIQPAFPMIDIDTGIQDGHGISGFLHASGFERPASFFHKLPKLLHLGDALDG